MQLAGWNHPEDDIRQTRLLRWLSRQGAQGIFDVGEFYLFDETLADQALTDVQALEHEGWVQPILSMGGSLAEIAASVTPAGRSHVRRIETLASDKDRRRLVVRAAIVAWLYELDAVEVLARSVSVSDFLKDRRSFYYGDDFKLDEVDRASAWLYRNALISGITVMQAEGPVRVFLTDDGVDCVENYDGDVARFARASSAPTPSEQPASETHEPPDRISGNEPMSVSATEVTDLRVFISHSSEDKSLAAAIVELIRSALSLAPETVRCSSVDGYRLPAGVDTDETLRREVYSTEVVIGVLTPHSLKSSYVQFELGARWGIGRPLVPLLARGASPAELPGPLQGKNALLVSEDAQCLQFVEDLAK